MRLPRSLPPLAEPSFVLAHPSWLQHGVLLLCAVLPLAGLVWLVHVHLTDGLTGSHYAAGAIMALVFSAVFHPRNRAAWVTFAADPRGIYLGTLRAGFVHVPWCDVGNTSIGMAGIGSNRQRTVILQLRVDEAAWAHLVGGRRRRAYAQTDEAGYRIYGIGSAGRDVEATQRQIESVRQAACPAPL